MKKLFFILTVLSLLLSNLSCKKDKLITDPSAKLNFSADSVLFDTVFTTIGSATRNIRVINNHKQKIKISNITLEKGTASQFLLNVDGMPGSSFSDIEIAANDSIYIFIQVNVNPTNSNSPLIITDAIQFNVNGNDQKVHLEAWGQDAYYHNPTNAIKFVNGGYLPYTTIAGVTNTTVTWNNDKPHVIYGWLVVDSSQTLVINAGVKVHFHQNAGLWVYRFGTLKVKGTLGNEVVFQGDRLEPYMQDIPGQWDRIWINEGSENNEIDFAIIKNGFIGVQCDLLLTDTLRRLKLTNTIIRNMSKWGLYGVAAHIYGGNNVISNCKEYCGYFVLGGRYTFIHTTFANYWTNDGRTTSAVLINNHYESQVVPLDTCIFANSIIYGNATSELDLDITQAAGPLKPEHLFENCLIKSGNSNDGIHFKDCRFGLDPGFTNVAGYNFGLANSNNAVDFTSASASNYALKFPVDITNKSRTGGFPDAGAIEK